MAWTAPRTWADTEIEIASRFNEQVRDNFDYLKTETDTLVDLLTKIKQLAPTRLSDTIYQNTTSKIILATIVADGANSPGVWDFCCGTSTTNLPLVAKDQAYYDDVLQIAEYCSLTAMIPPNYYYKASRGASPVSLYSWKEWQLYDT